jgi:hypothetical protein
MEERVEQQVEQPVVEEQPDELAVAQQQRDEYLDALQRLKAEFDNYRKRVAGGPPAGGGGAAPPRAARPGDERAARAGPAA